MATQKSKEIQANPKIHLGFLKFESFTIRSAVPDNSTLEPIKHLVCNRSYASLNIWKNGGRPPSSSRSCKAIDLVVAIESACNFLLVISITLAISLTVFETLTHKARKYRVFPTYPCLTVWHDTPAQVEPVRISGIFCMKLNPQKLEGWGCCVVKIAWP